MPIAIGTSCMKNTMNLLDAGRSFANRGGHSLDAAKSNVPYGENTRDIGLKEFRSTYAGPHVRPKILSHEISPCSYKPPFIECDTTIKPVRGRYCAGHEENVSNTVRLGSALHTLPCDPLQLLIAFEGLDLSVDVKVDVRRFRNTPNEVLRHTLRQTLGTYQQMHAPTRRREKYRSLARRVAASDDNDLTGSTTPRFGRGCCIINSHPQKS
jgi:hypothetical protein